MGLYDKLGSRAIKAALKHFGDYDEIKGSRKDMMLQGHTSSKKGIERGYEEFIDKKGNEKIRVYEQYGKDGFTSKTFTPGKTTLKRIKDWMGYKKGGSLNKPKGVGVALRGFGKVR